MSTPILVAELKQRFLVEGVNGSIVKGGDQDLLAAHYMVVGCTDHGHSLARARWALQQGQVILEHGAHSLGLVFITRAAWVKVKDQGGTAGHIKMVKAWGVI